MRGSNSLFNDYFPISPAEKQRRGRSETFDSQRNECLIYRYQYFGAATGFRYEILVKIIARQFWLSEVTVTNILTLNYDIRSKARKDQPTQKFLKEKWPHMSWELPNIKDYTAPPASAAADGN